MRLFGRVPFVPQLEATECGAASLAMLLAYHGSAVSLQELREACAISRDGASALDVVKAAKKYGLTAKALKAESVDALAGVPLPAILHWEMNHFLVLERLDARGADLVDPAHGRRRVSRDELGRAFSGVVITGTPGPAFVHRRASSRSAEAYRRLVRGAGGPVAVMLASALVLEMLGLFFPAATGLVVDFVVRPRQERWIAVIAIAFAVALSLRVAVTVARDRLLRGLEARLEIEVSAGLVRHLLSLPTKFFAQRGTGDLLGRVGSLLAARETFTRVVLAAFDVLLVVVYGTMMLLYDVRLGGVVVLLEVLTLAVSVAGRRRARPAAIARQAAAARASGALVQAFTDPETAKAFGAEPTLLARYGSARARELNAKVDVQLALEGGQHALALLGALGGAAVMLLGGRAVLDDRMTIGTLSSFVALQSLLSPALHRVVGALQDLADLAPVLDRVDDVFETTPEASGTLVPERFVGAITFDEVSFRYGAKGPMLLDRVSFHVAPGERVAFVGASGAGKSTILKLVLGFVQPTSGRILIDGRDLREYDLDALRSAMGAVMAGGAFFDESVFDNVTLGAPEATPAELSGALRAACVADVVDGLPEGPLTKLGTNASRLSGGQRQRLLLARALVKNPRVLLLDEASSALDAALEQRIQAWLSQLQCTMIIVAHRLSAVALADRILVLSGGRIVEEGSFRQLASRPGVFQAIVRTTEVAA